jgi:drug/metabolite transporter (DMT)-like permease
MLSSSNLIFTALLTVFFLKKTYHRQHVTSIFVIVLGMSLVALALILNNESNEDHTTSELIIGIICLQSGELIGAIGYIVEEKFFSQ